MSIKAEMEVEYAASICPPTFRVCGLRLRQITTGHAVLLTAMRNPMLPWIGGEIGIGDWAQFVMVCLFPWRVSRWISNTRLAKPVMKLLVHCRTGSMTTDDAPLIAYIRWNLIDGPQLQSFTGGSARTCESESPSLGYIISRFIEFGIGRDEILDTSYRLLRWDHAVCVDRSGHQILKASMTQEVRERLIEAEIERAKSEGLDLEQITREAYETSHA